MATWAHRTITSRRDEWAVPTGAWGAAAGDLADALAAAWAQYRHHHGLPDDAPMTDDFARIHVTDDEVVVTVTTEEPTR